ncbi:MAG: sigma-70 family RNA polymerase sigma factor [Prevotella sp.]
MTEAERNRQRFETVWRENYSRLYCIAYDFLQDDEASRDVVSEVFARAWQKWDEMQPETVTGYLFIGVRNTCYNRLRERGSRDRYADYVKHFYDTVEYCTIDETDERINDLNRTIERLPQKTRFVLRQCYYEKHTYKEVGAMLGITPDGVKRHIVKALAMLREHFNVK